VKKSKRVLRWILVLDFPIAVAIYLLWYFDILPQLELFLDTTKVLIPIVYVLTGIGCYITLLEHQPWRNYAVRYVLRAERSFIRTAQGAERFLFLVCLVMGPPIAALLLVRLLIYYLILGLLYIFGLLGRLVRAVYAILFED
jgi:hypothetical protein